MLWYNIHIYGICTTLILYWAEVCLFENLNKHTKNEKPTQVCLHTPFNQQYKTQKKKIHGDELILKAVTQALQVNIQVFELNIITNSIKMYKLPAVPSQGSASKFFKEANFEMLQLTPDTLNVTHCVNQLDGTWQYNSIEGELQ